MSPGASERTLWTSVRSVAVVFLYYFYYFLYYLGVDAKDELLELSAHAQNLNHD